jgi:nucleoid-associated protein YgaU
MDCDTKLQQSVVTAHTDLPGGFTFMQLGRYAALAALLIGGACAALPFARPSPLAQQTASAEAKAPAARLALPQIAVEGDDEAVSPVPSGDIVPASWHQPTPIVLPPDGVPLPSLPHEPLLRTTIRDAASRIHQPDFAAIEPAPSSHAKTPARRKHRIADGDSLELIALRYLGEKERAAEIAALNRDVFSDPSLLPVGREIVIPGEDGH